MIKLSTVEETQQTDESGRKILIATGPRLFFRENFSTGENDLSKIKNSELNNIIAADLLNSETLKSFPAKSSNVEDKARDLGVLKKSKQFNIYYVCIQSNSQLRVVSIQREIKTSSKNDKKFPSKIMTGILDPATNLEIAVTTTVRNFFRKSYAPLAFPTDTTKTFANVGLLELSKYIAELFASRSSDIKHNWRLKDDSVGEIRSFGRNRFFVSSQKQNSIDILSVQGSWFSEKYNEYVKRVGYNPRRQNRTLNRG